VQIIFPFLRSPVISKVEPLLEDGGFIVLQNRILSGALFNGHHAATMFL